MEVKNRKFEILNERRHGLRPAARLYYYYIEHADKLNRVSRSKDDVARALNVSPRTVANWAHALVSAGLIKYKYSGSARLNPEFYFEGTNDNYEYALREFKSFRSDI